MAANPRYNFTIHAKAKVGRLIGLAYITGYFGSDQDAIDFATWLNGTALANYAKVSVSKVILDVDKADWEIPTSHTITDIKNFKALMVNSTVDSIRRSIVVPGLKPSVSDDDIVTALTGAGFTSGDLVPMAYDKIVTYTPSFTNVITGGPA